ncbi:Fructosamine kinase-domain-containing protein [Xylogone sp. PMI_703]|nr:Fructosamine kinase-domain-containing protein [Xylogone sp. PMI_703]
MALQASGGISLEDITKDRNFTNALPSGAIILKVERYGFSEWATTARISMALHDGTKRDYFLKIASEDIVAEGGKILKGEFEGMKRLWETLPDFIPKPIACGNFSENNPKSHFLLCDFIKMTNVNPDKTRFCQKLAKLHHDSSSPDKRFGFDFCTYTGRVRQYTEWESSWETFFRKQLEEILLLDRELDSPWVELDTVAKRVIDKVIPKLLGPLESIVPCLIHGDLWQGNAGASEETKNIYIFDGAVYYAHNEMEVAMWTSERHKELESYLDEYFKFYPPSEPKAQLEDRLKLYSLKGDIIHSISQKLKDRNSTCKERRIAYEKMCYLVNKYDPTGESPDNC